MQAENGLTLETLAPSAYGAFHCAGGTDANATWETLSEGEMDRWRHVGGQAILSVEGADGLGWAELARQLYASYIKAGYGVFPAMAELPVAMQLAWEAVGRHMANCIDSDGTLENLPEHEGRWKEWVQKKLASLSQPQGV